MLGTTKCIRPPVAPAARPQSRRSVLVAAHQVIAFAHPAWQSDQRLSGSRAVPPQTAADCCEQYRHCTGRMEMHCVMARLSSRDSADSAYHLRWRLQRPHEGIMKAALTAAAAAQLTIAGNTPT